MGKKGNVDGGDGQGLQGSTEGYEDKAQDLGGEVNDRDDRVGPNESVGKSGGHGPWKTGE
jgi:hypothetical protein